jgi:saccharopine dehydrogenase-like NADP-dependent oxidoreductase
LKTILLFGAGKSATVLISYLLEESAKNNWKLVVADANLEQITGKTQLHPSSEAVAMDITDANKRGKLISESSLVISMMPPSLHILIAKDCITHRKSLLTASYCDEAIKSLEPEVKEKGLLFLCEMGLDPGIDHMSAMVLIDAIKAEGGAITRFKSHCGGLVAPESDNNPWRYKISWNPRNVVMAGKAGAIYLSDGKTIEENYESLFDPARTVSIGEDDKQVFSFYPNRNSLPYIDVYGLQTAHTFLRTTLRYRDFMYGWRNIIDLKLTDESPIYQTDGLSLQDFFKMHLTKHGFGTWLDKKLSERFAETKELLENLKKLVETEEEANAAGEEVPEAFMLVDEKGDLKKIGLQEVKDNAATVMAAKLHEANLTLKQLFFLGLDDKDTIINLGLCSAADVLQFALEKKLLLLPGDKDMIVMLHEIEYMLNGKQHQISSSLVVKGDDHIHTAMAKTVGLPLGIAAKLILNGELNLTGLHIPTLPEIYKPVLEILAKQGIVFQEKNS